MDEAVEDPKRIMADKAYGLIEPGERVFLDISSLTLELARRIAAGDKRMVVVSNMPAAIEAVAANSLVEAVSTGGELVEALGGYMGVDAAACVERMRPDRCFLGAGGNDAESGAVATSNEPERVFKRAVLASSARRCLVAGSDKLGAPVAVPYANLREFDTLVSWGLDDAERAWVEDLGVEVV
jgi:DeoR family glycerol-3-phosphate regulon repressor